MTDMHLALVRAVVAPENLAMIEADLRERIAEAIEAERDAWPSSGEGDAGYDLGMTDAARIAREATP